MMNSVFTNLFGCSHSRTTFPQTPRQPSKRQGTHVTCLDCGKEFPYNWKEMRMEPVPVSKDAVRAHLPVERPLQQTLSRLLRLGS